MGSKNPARFLRLVHPPILRVVVRVNPRAVLKERVDRWRPLLDPVERVIPLVEIVHVEPLFDLNLLNQVISNPFNYLLFVLPLSHLHEYFLYDAYVLYSHESPTLECDEISDPNSPQTLRVKPRMALPLILYRFQTFEFGVDVSQSNDCLRKFERLS